MGRYMDSLDYARSDIRITTIRVVVPRDGDQSK